MVPDPISISGDRVDLTPRLRRSVVVVASPAAAAETIVCQTPAFGDIAVVTGVIVIAFVAFTVGTNGVSVNLKIRQTDANGTTIAATGVTNEGVTAATQLGTRLAVGFDTAAVVPGQVYVATLTVGSGSAASTVSAVSLIAIAV